MVKFIESELVLLKKEIDEMWTLVYNQLDRAGDAVLTLDRELAQQVLVRERRVNAFELKIDSDVEDIIALYNPVAIDLRFVLAMLKINTNLERLGDFAEGIARFALNCHEPALDTELVKQLRLEEMIAQVLSKNWLPLCLQRTICWTKSMRRPLPFLPTTSAGIRRVHSLV